MARVDKVGDDMDGEREEIQDCNRDTYREMIQHSLEFNDEVQDSENLMLEREVEIGCLQIENEVLNEDNIHLKEENVKLKEENMKSCCW